MFSVIPLQGFDYHPDPVNLDRNLRNRNIVASIARRSDRLLEGWNSYNWYPCSPLGKQSTTGSIFLCDAISRDSGFRILFESIWITFPP